MKRQILAQLCKELDERGHRCTFAMPTISLHHGGATTAAADCLCRHAVTRLEVALSVPLFPWFGLARCARSTCHELPTRGHCSQVKGVMAAGSLVGLRHRVQKEFRSLLLVEMHNQCRCRVLNTKSASGFGVLPVVQWRCTLQWCVRSLTHALQYSNMKLVCLVFTVQKNVFSELFFDVSMLSPVPQVGHRLICRSVCLYSGNFCGAPHGPGPPQQSVTLGRPLLFSKLSQRPGGKASTPAVRAKTMITASTRASQQAARQVSSHTSAASSAGAFGGIFAPHPKTKF